MDLIEVKNLFFGYSNGEETLKNISLNVKKGDFLAIFGENGSGKSTLMKCILGLNKVQNGSIKVEGRIGYLPQLTEIQNNFPATIEEIVLSGTIPSSPFKIFYTKDDKEKAKKIMEGLNLWKIRKKCFYELSGGQKQRVLIARALCATDNILVLDEPVNGLDTKIVNQIYELLYKLNKEKNITIVMVSHDVDRALKYVNRVIEIEIGKVVKDMTSEKYIKEVLKNDRGNK